MSSAAERYAAARRRGAYPELTRFRAELPFVLDDFQIQACEALEDGSGVLVAAPTGAGKTVVGEFAVALALRAGRKCFYTTPIKALSNQKYADLRERHGAASVGLLTGDNAINGDAPVVVMTTEVLRNMLYAGSSALTGLGYVVMDEVHYLADRFRGAVWEEVIIHLPASVTLVSLSATVSNAEEFADWLVTVRGDTQVVVSEERPVPLWQHMLVGTRIFDLFARHGSRDVDPQLARYVREQERRLEGRWEDRRGQRPRRGRPTPRPDVIDRLDREGLLPAIDFIFSRAGCQAAVQQCLSAGLRLNDDDERHRVRAIVERHCAVISPDDLHVLGYWEWLDGLERGVAAHHAGLIPTFKETVEELFIEGLVKVVFATETLALGINMPARSVLLERLVKFNGETHADITAGEYTQLTGRAGRRGIDIEGHAVVQWAPGVDPGLVAGLASTRTYPLRSSFRPSYNMAVNLVGQVGRAAARQLLESSFAQFQADRSVVGLARQVTRNTEALDGYAEAMRCHLGDFAEYAELRRRIKDRESLLSREGATRRRSMAVESLETLRPGDVIRIPAGRRQGLAVVLDPGHGAVGEPRPLVLTEQRWAGRLSSADFPAPVLALARVAVPKHFNHRSPQARRDLAATLRTARMAADLGPRKKGRSAAADDGELARLRDSLRSHPCHGCADREDHARWAERWARLQRETDALTRRVQGKTHSIGRSFDRVCALLEERGYLAGDTVTDSGRALSRIWSESDLLVAECLRTGAWEDLDAASLAGVVSAVLYESRTGESDGARVPDGAIRPALAATVTLWADLEAAESRHRLELTREPDLGFCWPAYRWTRGEPLDRVLSGLTESGQELAAGDFVRWCRQLLDLLDQIAKTNAGPAAATARAAITAIRRGVVAQSGVS
ncbi:MAG: DEAD/DEAH box helicase [Geodermatophilaceae bacterium]|nr:DEAD/DEAH box helicase [Geodermatophilaceae bacterium]